MLKWRRMGAREHSTHRPEKERRKPLSSSLSLECHEEFIWPQKGGKSEGVREGHKTQNSKHWRDRREKMEPYKNRSILQKFKEKKYKKFFLFF